MKKLIIVTGSRDWPNDVLVEKALQKASSVGSEIILMHGGCPTGADHMADRYWSAEWPEDAQLIMPAQWEKEGKAAGPLRNQRMVDIALAMQACGWVVIVLAFPLSSSKGTTDMIRRCKKAGLNVSVTGKTRG